MFARVELCYTQACRRSLIITKRHLLILDVGARSLIGHPHVWTRIYSIRSASLNKRFDHTIKQTPGPYKNRGKSTSRAPRKVTP